MKYPTQKQLLELFGYEPETGHLLWRKRPLQTFATPQAGRTWNARFAGSIAGTDDGKGYIRVRVFEKAYKAHTLVWIIHYGAPPQNVIDHINGKTSDNRLANLRDVSHTDNGRNMRQSKNNTTGAVGVYWDKRYTKWRASITINRRHMYLGMYENFEGAVAARKAAEVKYGFHENHGRAENAEV